MTTDAFIDTNILLYAVSNSVKEIEKKWLARGLLEKKNFALSPQVLQEFYVNATSELAHTLPEAESIEFIAGWNNSRSFSPTQFCSIMRWKSETVIAYPTGTRRFWRPQTRPKPQPCLPKTCRMAQPRTSWQCFTSSPGSYAFHVTDPLESSRNLFAL
jgi:hypothetical protein